MTKRFTFLAGKYYVGDPCYAVKNENWDTLINTTGCFGLDDRFETPYDNWDDGVFIYNDQKCFASGTAYGDGEFYDEERNVYGVDAGLIGIIPVEACDGDSMDGGNILEFMTDFKVYEKDGSFHFGSTIINTKYDEDDK